MHSLISGYYPRSLEYPRHNSQIKWSSRRRKNKVWIFLSFLEGRTKYPQKKIERQSMEQILKERHSEAAQPRDPSHIQLQNPDTIVDAYKCLLTGAWYRCHLGGSASAWQIQRGHTQPAIELSGESPMEELEKDPRSWRGLQHHRRNNNMNHPVPPELPGTKPPTKEYT